ncbi:metacaspase-1, partial [Trifolium medium]|nr:metacaspase-1 [Trifolium medium]
MTANKRAVLCGVSYSRRRYRLKGTVNDVVNMNSLL